MVAKSIVDIDVNDDKFVAFMERFREYQSALEDLPEAWRVAAVGIGEGSKETEKAKGEAKGLGEQFNAIAEAILTINSGLDRLNNNLDDSKKKQDEFNKSARSGKGFISDATKDAKSLAGHIKDDDSQSSFLGEYRRRLFWCSRRRRPVRVEPAGGHDRRAAVYLSWSWDQYRRAGLHGH